ncbi:MAG: dipeptidase PepE [Candidatus Rokubacteria bacterium]|nr:dipeptidase PepE [Candidatus Rokubacteria bacterium]
MRVLLISNSGRPYLEHCRGALGEFYGPAVRKLGFVSAATLADPEFYFTHAKTGLEPLGVELEHVHWERQPLKTLERVDALFVGGGNTYALLDRVRSSGLQDAIKERARTGMPYAGASAGANLAGPTILTTNDWNIVALTHFAALHLVPFNINPHFKDTDPAMAPGSETREDRIREYHVRNKNAVVGIEEQTMVRVDDGIATVLGQQRVKLFRVGQAPRWFTAGERLPL